MTQIHLRREDVLKQKGRIQSSLFNAETLPQQEKERLNERLSDILTKTGKDTDETT